MLSNCQNGVIYVGVTADLVRRGYEHREGIVEGFSKRYGLKRLVYFERHEEILGAIAREKAVKAWRRAWKVALIEAANPGWEDLWPGIL